MQYLLTLQVSRYCILALHGSVVDLYTYNEGLSASGVGEKHAEESDIVFTRFSEQNHFLSNRRWLGQRLAQH